MEGWVKLHRCLIDKPIFDNANLLKVWIWCLCKATHKTHIQVIGLKKVELITGQFITGRNSGAAELKLKPSTFWDYMQFLKDNQSIDINSNSKYSVVTVANWGLYQVEENNSDSKTDNKPTAKQQPSDTNKNGKTVKNDKKTIIEGFTNNVELLEAINSFVEMRKSLKKPMTDNAIKLMLNKLNKLSTDDAMKIEILNQSIMSSWTDIYELKQQKLFDKQGGGVYNGKYNKPAGEIQTEDKYATAKSSKFFS